MNYKSLLVIILFVGSFSYFGLPIFTPKIEQRNPSLQFWQSQWVEENSTRVHQVMGVILGKTKLRDLIGRFGNRFQVAVYISEHNNAQLEVYFRETEVGTITGRVFATLNAEQSNIKQSIEGIKPKVLPNYDKRYMLGERGHLDFMDTTIKSISFTPTAIRLTQENVDNLFGIADQVIEEKIAGNKVLHYLYTSKGLDVQISAHSPSTVQYSDINEFSQMVLEPLQKYTAEIK